MITTVFAHVVTIDNLPLSRYACSLFFVIKLAYSRQSILGLKHEWFIKLSFCTLECGLHDRLHIFLADTRMWSPRQVTHLPHERDILLPLAYSPHRRDQRLLMYHPKDTAPIYYTISPLYLSTALTPPTRRLYYIPVVVVNRTHVRRCFHIDLTIF